MSKTGSPSGERGSTSGDSARSAASYASASPAASAVPRITMAFVPAHVSRNSLPAFACVARLASSIGTALWFTYANVVRSANEGELWSILSTDPPGMASAKCPRSAIAASAADSTRAATDAATADASCSTLTLSGETGPAEPAGAAAEAAGAAGADEISSSAQVKPSGGGRDTMARRVSRARRFSRATSPLPPPCPGNSSPSDSPKMADNILSLAR
mmetsp:Transcript_19158/g.56816  ORF Transcript_19158/g.56816 Transcript_19158/m.56816 type:complete len:216 (-) Transcript_19158:54-701(-)